MDNNQVEVFEPIYLLDAYNGEALVCNKIIALSFDGETANSLISEIKQRGGILASEAFIMKIYNKDESGNLSIGFSDSDYDNILKLRSSKDYHKDEDIIVKLSNNCYVQVVNIYINGELPGSSCDNSSQWYFIAKKPDNLNKYFSITSPWYNVVYKTPIFSEAEFMWDSITKKDNNHYVMYATGMYGNLNIPKVIKET